MAAPNDEDDRQDALSRPLLILSDGIDRTATEAALPGFDLLMLADLAPGEAGHARLCLTAPGKEDATRDALVAAGLAHLPVAVWQDDPAGLVLALATTLEATLADAGAARRASALLRRENEALNRRFKALENFVWTLGGPHTSLALSWAPGAGIALPSGEGRKVRQRLPIDVSALAAVELLLPEADPEDAATLDVAIEDSEGRCHPLQLATGAAWRMDGWLRFATEQPLSIDPQDGALVITAPQADMIFGLGLPVPDPDFTADGLEGAGEATLALRVWKGIAGTAGQMAPTAPAIAGLQHERVMPSDLPAPTLLAKPTETHDYVKTEFWTREDAFLVHPSENGPVCAVIPRVPAGSLQRLSAVVCNGRSDSAVLGFALGFAPAGQATAENWPDFIGEWLFLPPEGWGEVHAPPRRSDMTGGQLWDVLLASCVAGNASDDGAWALFRAFRFSQAIEE